MYGERQEIAQREKGMQDLGGYLLEGKDFLRIEEQQQWWVETEVTKSHGVGSQHRARFPKRGGYKHG